MNEKLQQVHLRVNDAATGKPTACRVHFSGPDKTYYAPYGRLTDFAASWTADCAGNIIVDGKEWAYIDGACEILLPPGLIHVEVSKGPEYIPICQDVTISPGKLSLRLTLERWINLREEGWYSGELGAHELTPHGALLEGTGEDLAVVNLLAEMRFVDLGPARSSPNTNMDDWISVTNEFNDLAQGWQAPNLMAFSGQQPCLTIPGHMVVVNTRNHHAPLTELDLLNCHRVVYPLIFGWTWEGDIEREWTLADWCDQCHRKNGLVSWSRLATWTLDCKASDELLANAIIGRIDCVSPAMQNPEYWYSLLICGLRMPLLCGRDRTAEDDIPLGELRTYARLQSGEELTYKNWIEAVRTGRSFVTEGPLLSFTVNGEGIGSTVHLSEREQPVAIHAAVRSLGPAQSLEVVFDGEVVAEGGQNIDQTISIARSGWLALRSRGLNNWITSHTSPIYVRLAGQRPRPPAQTVNTLLAQLDGGRAHVEKAPYSDTHRARLLGIFDNARDILTKLLPASP